MPFPTVSEGCGRPRRSADSRAPLARFPSPSRRWCFSTRCRACRPEQESASREPASATCFSPQAQRVTPCDDLRRRRAGNRVEGGRPSLGSPAGTRCLGFRSLSASRSGWRTGACCPRPCIGRSGSHATRGICCGAIESGEQPTVSLTNGSPSTGCSSSCCRQPFFQANARTWFPANSSACLFSA